jgi:hypothetical protein
MATSARTQARKQASKARSSTVKRAAMLKALSEKGGNKRATTKRRLEKSGATGREWH